MTRRALGVAFVGDDLDRGSGVRDGTPPAAALRSRTARQALCRLRHLSCWGRALRFADVPAGCCLRLMSRRNRGSPHCVAAAGPAAGLQPAVRSPAARRRAPSARRHDAALRRLSRRRRGRLDGGASSECAAMCRLSHTRSGVRICPCRIPPAPRVTFHSRGQRRCRLVPRSAFPGSRHRTAPRISCWRTGTVRRRSPPRHGSGGAELRHLSRPRFLRIVPRQCAGDGRRSRHWSPIAARSCCRTCSRRRRPTPAPISSAGTVRWRSKSVAGCRSCHTQESCLTCHRAELPGPVKLLYAAGPGRGPGAQTDASCAEQSHARVADPSRSGRVGVDAELHQLSRAAGMSHLSQAGSGLARQLSSRDLPHPAPRRRLLARQLLHRLPQHRPVLPELSPAIGLTARRTLIGAAGYHDGNRQFFLGHGQAARQALESCVSCHVERDCLTCHSVVRGRSFDPHGPGFDPVQMLKKNPQLCIACHGTSIPTRRTSP